MVLVTRQQLLLELHIELNDIFCRYFPNHILSERNDDSVFGTLGGKINT